MSTSALAVNAFGHPGQKGSVLIFPDIRAGVINGSTYDTIIRITNDGASSGVSLKCYYASSDPVPTPNSSTAAQLRSLKHFYDFTIDLTRNQPIAWQASNGAAIGSSRLFSGVPAGFGLFPDGAARTGGELKCWAMTSAGDGERAWNHLFGTASVIITAGPGAGQAYEYTAWAFQSLANGGAAAANVANPTPGAVILDGNEYDVCPAALVGQFSIPGVNTNRVVLASCSQDLRQAYTPTITKLTWTFWNQDEQAITGMHQCADSWYETAFPAGSNEFNLLNSSGLRTTTMYFRIDPTIDRQICGPDTTTAGYVGTMSEREAGSGLYTRGTNLTGRGMQVGIIRWDPFGGDVQKQ